MSPAQFADLLNECKLSPEELGARLGVSGMTVRRWVEKKSDEALPELYQRSLRDAIFNLVVEGRLDSESKFAQEVFSGQDGLAQQAALKALGFPEIEGSFEDHQEKIMEGLAHIGAKDSRRKKVDNSKEKIPAYKRFGREWSERISILMDAITSNHLSASEKLPAYGALFYLLMAFDLIPDTIPVFGLLDDFSILGLAAAYYAQKRMKG